MSPVPSLMIGRFARLPRVSGETWQGGLVRVPSWLHEGPDGKPYRPWAAIWVSLRTGLVHVKIEAEPGAHDWTLALEGLLEFGLKHNLAGCRPARLEVADEELGTHLVRALGDEDLALTVSRYLPVVTQMLAEMGEHMTGAPLPPDALAAAGVTVDRMRAFAAAAKRFYEAALWRHLTDEDLIHVEAPVMKPGLRYVTVLGAGGRTFGLGFFDTVEEFERLQEGTEPGSSFEGRGTWSVVFGPIWDMPFGEVDLWEDHGLPVAGEEAYPIAIRFGPHKQMRRPDAAVLSRLEGLLLALAETTESEIDQGRWSRQVEAYDKLTTFELCIPALLEPLDAPPARRRAGLADRRVMERVLTGVERFMARSAFDDLEQANEAIRRRFSGFIDDIPSMATTPLEKAQELVYRAFEAPGRRRIQLARKALALSPDCADAYVVLAEHTSDLERARDLYEQGVAAGERALGPRTFAEEAGHFWGMIGTRPYMRARFGLAQNLEGLGRMNEAIDHYRELLRLNPNDNQGVRYILLPALLVSGRDDEAGALLRQFEGEPTALWRYGQALWTFRQEGDSRSARDRLREALRSNRRVPKYLAGETEWPDPEPQTYALGSEEEAVICAGELGDVWRATPGAERWLNAWRSQGRSRKRRGR
ncbi:MAG: tetratricopeptide repeat protein [Candidatus Methylomirabilia bacterium]